MYDNILYSIYIHINRPAFFVYDIFDVLELLVVSLDGFICLLCIHASMYFKGSRYTTAGFERLFLFYTLN